MSRPLVWLTGDCEDPSLAPAANWLRGVADCLVISADDLPMAAGPIPTAIVLFQSRPGRIAQGAVEQLHHRAPLARLLAVVGPWCEGEVRSGHPWEGVTRIYWHQWQARLPREMGLTAGAAGWPGYRPRTLTETEILLRTLTPALHRKSLAGLVAISTAGRESFGALADACWAAGWRAVWQQPDWPPQYVGADLLLIDGWEGLPPDLASARSAGRELPPAVLLVSWPRPDDVSRAGQHGISRVLARPLLLTDLFATLDAALGHEPKARPAQSAA